MKTTNKPQLTSKNRVVVGIILIAIVAIIYSILASMVIDYNGHDSVIVSKVTDDTSISLSQDRDLCNTEPNSIFCKDN